MARVELAPYPKSLNSVQTLAGNTTSLRQRGPSQTALRISAAGSNARKAPQLDHKNVPGKTFGGVGEFSRDLVSECAKVIGKLLGGVFVGEDYGEVDVAGAGEVVALGF